MTDAGDRGLQVYRSDDLDGWTPQARNPILFEPGTRPDDGVRARHAMVLSQGASAYAFYFTHPGGQRSSIQAAELSVVDGQLTANRDTPFEMDLRPDATVDLRGGTRPTE